MIAAVNAAVAHGDVAIALCMTAAVAARVHYCRHCAGAGGVELILRAQVDNVDGVGARCRRSRRGRGRGCRDTRWYQLHYVDVRRVHASRRSPSSAALQAHSWTPRRSRRSDSRAARVDDSRRLNPPPPAARLALPLLQAQSGH